MDISRTEEKTKGKLAVLTRIKIATRRGTTHTFKEGLGLSVI